MLVRKEVTPATDLDLLTAIIENRRIARKLTGREANIRMQLPKL